MFSINGADTIGVESSRITGLENIYQPLWDLFLQNSMYWNTLPDKRIALPDDRTYTFPFAGEGGEVTIRTQQAVAQKLFPVLRHGRSVFQSGPTSRMLRSSRRRCSPSAKDLIRRP